MDCRDGSDEKVNKSDGEKQKIPMFELQNCEILKLDKNYRGELFPRELDNSALTVYINVSILAFPKV